MVKINDKYRSNLFKWNLIMGFLHLAQGLFMALISKESLTQIKIWLPQVNPMERSFDLAPENWYEINLGYTISLFLFASALAHFITIAPKIFDWYLDKLALKVNLIRWFEYALSSSIMVYVIAILCGINDGMLLFALVSLNACMNLFGAIMEMHNSSLRQISLMQQLKVSSSKKITVDLDEDKEFKPNWSSFIYGCFAGVVPWIIMAVYFFVSLDRLGNLEGLPQRVKDVLNTVRWIFPILFVFFNLFAINMYLQYSKFGKWKSYLFGEKTYIILSLVAKSFLAWFIWGGTLRG